MTLGRISTYALHQSTLRDAAHTQFELFKLQTQLSSGYKSQTFEGMADQTEQFLGLETRISKIDLYLKNNKLIESRVNTTVAVIDQTIETGTQIKNLILLRRNATTEESLAFPEQITNMWKALVAQLNTNSEGRYLFSGTRTDSLAVDADTFPTLEESGVPDTGYYLGSSENITARIDDNTDFTYNIRADEEGFQKIFAGLAMAMQGHNEQSDEDLAAAYTLVDEGVKAVISLQAKANANKVSISQVNERHESFKIYWKGVIEDVGSTDLVSVSTQVAINQGILQASFQAFGLINSLKLSDFLR